jgi:hypothetical protein
MDNQVVNNLMKRVQETRDKLIIQRTIFEKSIDEFATRIKDVDPALSAELGLPGIISARTLLPELYEENIDPERLKEQQDRLIILFENIEKVQNRLIKKAQEMLGD